MSNNTVSRRNFIAGAAGAAAVSALVGSSETAALAQETEAAQEPLESAIGYGNIQCGEDWLGQPPVVSDDQIVETVDVEVVVCGSGHAGTQCALAAAQGGAKVAVLEVQAKETYAANGTDFATYNSEYLTNLGFGGYNLGEVVGEYVRRGAGALTQTSGRAMLQIRVRCSTTL